MSAKYTSFSYTFKNIGYIAVSAVCLLFISKSLIRRNRDNDYENEVRVKMNNMSNDQADDEINRKYSRIAKEANYQASKNDQNPLAVPKSEYEGIGSSYLSRKRGDKLGFWDKKD
ncbi:hypothetical protein ACO0QE_004583 [Hanseniaspora vineae]